MEEVINVEQVEKIITDINKIAEADYKQNHIFMWEFVLNRLLDASLKINDKDIYIPEVKEEYLHKVKARLEERKFLGVKDTWLLEKLTEGIQNYCWACCFSCLEGKNGCICNNCPLLEKNGGKLKHACTSNYSTWRKVCIAAENGLYSEAVKLAERIKDAWREVK